MKSTKDLRRSPQKDPVSKKLFFNVPQDDEEAEAKRQYEERLEEMIKADEKIRQIKAEKE